MIILVTRMMANGAIILDPSSQKASNGRFVFLGAPTKKKTPGGSLTQSNTAPDLTFEVNCTVSSTVLLTKKLG